MGRVSSKERPGHLSPTFRVLNTLVPNSPHVTAALRPAGPKRLWSSGKDNLCPGRGGPGGEAAGKERESEPRLPTRLGERDVTHLRDLFAILQVPHRRGLGGDAVQPPPASGERSFSLTLPPLASLPLRGDRVRNASPRQGRTEGRRGRPRPAPGPQRCS